MLYAALDTIATILSCAHSIVDFEPLADKHPGMWASQCIELWTENMNMSADVLRARGLI